MTLGGLDARILLTALLAAWALVGRCHASEGLDMVLVHAFRLPPGESWRAVSIHLSPGQWRSGGPNGSTATEFQMKAVLRSLVGIEIGGRCASWIDGETAYACGLSMRNVDLAGVVKQDHVLIAVDQAAVESARANTEVSAPHKGELPASPVARVPRLDVGRFVALHLPTEYLGDQSRAYAGSLRFEIRAMPNAIMPSRFAYDSGLVILRAKLPGERS